MFSWFDLEFPWIGIGAGVALAIVALTTDAFRADLSVARWRDPSWLAWLAVPTYLIHNFEEYGIAANGTFHAFPTALCLNVGWGGYPTCPIPPVYFDFVNIPLFWIAAPACALLARRYVIVGLSMWGVIFANGLFHIGGAVVTGSYNPGLLTASLLFAPLTAWVLWVVFLSERGLHLGPKRMVPLLAGGGLLNALLPLELFAFRWGWINEPMLLLLQIVHPLILVGIAAIIQRRMPISAQESTGASEPADLIDDRS